MTTATVTYTDLERLRELMMELHEAGRLEESHLVARAHAVMEGVYTTENFPWLDDDDPEFDRQMEEAERDFAEGRWIPHEEVVRKLRAIENGED